MLLWELLAMSGWRWSTRRRWCTQSLKWKNILYILCSNSENKLQPDIYWFPSSPKADIGRQRKLGYQVKRLMIGFPVLSEREDADFKAHSALHDYPRCFQLYLFFVFPHLAAVPLNFRFSLQLWLDWILFYCKSIFQMSWHRLNYCAQAFACLVGDIKMYLIRSWINKILAGWKNLKSKRLICFWNWRLHCR